METSEKFEAIDYKLSENETLGSLVVTYRVLGLFKNEAKQAMIEIMSRKKAGSKFDFDAFIKENVEICKHKPIEIPLKLY
jgi:hypothetical protein